jgi:glycine betaine/proline transport system substrate-binding protein
MRLAATVSALGLLAACTGDDPDAERGARTEQPPTSNAECGDFRIAYDPSHGYEASAFIVGTIAEDRLDCEVEYVAATPRDAWRLVARGDADVYLDAYGNADLRQAFARRGGPLRIVT